MTTSFRLPKLGLAGRLLLALLLLGSLAGRVWSQSSLSSPPAALVTYPIGDTIVFLASAGMVAASYPLEARKPAATLSARAQQTIPWFDQWYTTHKSQPLSIASDVTLATTALLPAVLIPSLSRKDIISGAVVYSETLALAYGVKSLVKSLVVRYRPYSYAMTTNAALQADPEVQSSFPSGHVTVAFAAAVAAGSIVDQFTTNRTERIAVWSTSLGLATATAVLRVWSGNHFVSDVVGAAAIGSLIGWVVPLLHSPKAMSAFGLPLRVEAMQTSGGAPLIEWNLQLP